MAKEIFIPNPGAVLLSVIERVVLDRLYPNHPDFSILGESAATTGTVILLLIVAPEISVPTAFFYAGLAVFSGEFGVSAYSTKPYDGVRGLPFVAEYRGHFALFPRVVASVLNDAIGTHNEAALCNMWADTLEYYDDTLEGEQRSDEYDRATEWFLELKASTGMNLEPFHRA